MEDETGKPIRLFVHGSKNGSEIAAYASAISELSTEILQQEDGFNKLLKNLSNHLGDKKISNGHLKCSSGPEGVWLALNEYSKVKYQKLCDDLGIDNVSRLKRN